MQTIYRLIGYIQLVNGLVFGKYICSCAEMIVEVMIFGIYSDLSLFFSPEFRFGCVFRFPDKLSTAYGK